VDTDLSSIPGLQQRHLTVLTGPLQLRTAQALAQADRRVVHAAMRRLRPAPTLEEIAVWQDHARDLADAAAAARPPGWVQAAAFVVSFEHHPDGAAPQRRVVVEQVEQAPPEPQQQWPAWQLEPAWAWMLERLEAVAAEPAEGPPPQPDLPQSEQAKPPPEITVSTPELVRPAEPVCPLEPEAPAVDIPPATVLRVTVASVPAAPLQVALRLRRTGQPSRALGPPVPAGPGGLAEISLDGLPPGDHATVLAVWDPAGKAAAVIVPLPPLRVAS
jgi:hypothetical protein